MQSVIHERIRLRRKLDEDIAEKGILEEVLESIYGKPTFIQRMSAKIFTVACTKKMKREG